MAHAGRSRVCHPQEEVNKTTVAAVEICESNDDSGESITHNVGDLDCGSIDAANLDPTANPVTVTEFAFFKLVRIHCTAINDSNQIDNFRVWKSAGDYVTDEGIQCNLHETQGSYDTYKITAWPGAPDANEYTAYAMPTSEPTANLGIGGSLTGALTAAGYSDYFKFQRQSGASTPPGDANSLTISFKYDEQ